MKKDIFHLFHKAHQVYILLQNDNPNVDVSFPGLTHQGDTPPTALVVQYEGKAEGREVKLDGPTEPYRKYLEQPKEIRGTLSEVEAKVQNFIEALNNSPVTIYNQLGTALNNHYAPGLKLFYHFCHEVLGSYPKNNLVEVPYELTACLEYPARLVCSYQELNQRVSYDFSKRKITISGIKEPELLKYKESLSVLKYPVELVEVKDVVTEGLAAVVLRLPSYRRPVILENEMFQQSSDDIVDTVVQHLVVQDALDALQDIILGEDNLVFFCFDPVLHSDEVNKLLDLIKSVYPQASISAAPGTGQSSWWVIEVGDISQPAVDVASAGTQVADEVDVEKGTIAKNQGDPFNQIAQTVDVNKVIAAVGEK